MTRGEIPESGGEAGASATVVQESTRTLVEKIRVPDATVREIAAFLRASAAFPDTAGGPPPVAVRDPDDAVILSEALVLRADVLITGDKDLLEAGKVPGIRILDPRGFWQVVRGEAL